MMMVMMMTMTIKKSFHGFLTRVTLFHDDNDVDDGDNYDDNDDDDD